MRKIIILAALIISSITTYSQTYTEAFDDIFRNVSRTDATTGILYERMIPFAQLYKFNSNVLSVDNSNYEHFIRSYSEFHKASFQPVNSLPFDCETFQSLLKSNDNVVDIGIFHYKFNMMDSAAAYQKLYFGVDSVLYENTTVKSSLYVEKTAFVASPLKEFVDIGSNIFRFRDILQFNNTGNQISGLNVDFNDGTGWKQITDTLITITYANSGIKTLRFEAILNNGDTLIAYAKLNCLDPSFKGGGEPGSQSKHPYIEVKKNIIAKITPSNPYEVGTTFTKAKGDICIYYANDMVNGKYELRQPILIVDGFDPENKRTFEKHTDDGKSLWQLFNYVDANGDTLNIGKQLLQKGYDLVILDPQEGGIYIEQNAMVCIEVINEINRRLAQSGSPHEIVVVGPSMGGQITRYALAYMENNPNDANTNYGKHNCRLWISFDSPHQGANISLGAQAMMKT